MDFFTALSLLMAVGIIGAAFLPRKIADPAVYRKALGFFIAGVILYHPVSALFSIGPYLSLVARPLGFVFVVVSLRLLCLALAAPRIDGK
jgi:hypothetical protein